MLPGELLICRTRKGRITPVFASLDGEWLKVARDIIEVFRKHIGRTQGELLRSIREIEDSSAVDHRYIKGLKTLLMRQCSFEVDAAVEPFLARKTVFKEASLNPVRNRGDREKVLVRVAGKLGLAVNDLEKALWADSEEMQILREFREIGAEELIRLYNTSLAQTLLFKAVSMTVRIKQGHKYLIRRVKRLGLMYMAERLAGCLHITIYGPASLLKMTEKYGTSMAKLLPAVIASPSWMVRADIVFRGSWPGAQSRASPRILEFRIDDSKRLLLTIKQPIHPTREFDSTVEEKFARSFVALRTGWAVTREPEPLVAGGRVFIPDFLLEKNGAKVYLEIVGFWTQEYLERKLMKLRKLEKVNLILAVDKNLACSGFKELKEFSVIYYQKEVPMKDVMRVLNKLEKEEIDRELRSLTEEGISIEGDIVDLEAVASERGVSYEAVRRALEGMEGYVEVGKEMVSHTKLKKLERKLLSFNRTAKYEDVAAVIKGEGIENVAAMLEQLGYEIKWASLDADNLRVIRKN